MAKTKSKPKSSAKPKAKPAKKAAPKPAKKIAKALKPAKKAIAKPAKIAPKEKEKKQPVIEVKAPEKAKKQKKEDLEIVKEASSEEAEIVLTDAEGRRYCRVQDCDQVAIVEAYCRYHYLLYWKKIQYRKKILVDNKFYKYIDELTNKYPDKFLEVIRKDLMSQKNFLNAIQEMEIDESSDEAELDDKSYLDDMRGITAEVGSGGEESNDDY